MILITLCYNVGWTRNDVEHRVIDDFERNKILIDLDKNPDEIKTAIRTVFNEPTINKEKVQNVGIHFMKFCNKWNMVKLPETQQNLGKYLTQL